MKKHDLLNFAKGLNPEPKNICCVYYRLTETNEIIITRLGDLWERDNERKIIDYEGIKTEAQQSKAEVEFQYIKVGESEYTPTNEQLKTAWINFMVEAL
jgi:hypothetical protein